MAKQDPFAKDDKPESPMKEEFADFGDPTKEAKGGGSKMKIVIAALLIIGPLAAAGVYFFTQQNSEDTAESMKTPTKPARKAETADMSAKPLSAAEVPVNNPPAEAPRMETSAMPSQTPPAVNSQTPPAPHVVTVTPAKPAKPEPHKMETKAPPPVVATTLPKVTKAEAAEDEEDTGEEDVSGSEAPTLETPENGAARNYDESSSAAQFTWSGKGHGWIAFSRSPRMSPIDLKVKTKGNSYDLPRLLPGVWYWQTGNGAGKSAIRMFTVNPPTKRSIALLEPMDGASLAKDSGMVAWKGDHKITYYRVEISNQGWANPNYRFATTGTQVQIRNVNQGPYQMRLGAFSEVSGRWEFTDPIKINVQ